MNDLRTGVRSWTGSVGRVMRQPVLRRILPGMLVSALGDGMSMVAVAWLAVQIAPPDQAGGWTGLAVAAYALPAPVGAALLARFVRRFRGAQLVAVDAALRAVALGLVAILAAAGLLNPVGYVALLAVSSLLHAWGNAGAYTLVAELLPDEDRVTGNALLSTFTTAAVVVGPALAGGLTALVGPGWVIGADAASFAVLAAGCWAAARRSAGPVRMDVAPAAPDVASAAPGVASAAPGVASAAPGVASAAPAVERAGEVGGGWRIILGQPRLLGLIAVTCVFFFLYGPVEVALPVHVAHELNGSPSLLGLYWTVFGIGATLGSLGAGLLRHRSPWLVVVGIIIGWGAALLPLGLTDAVAPGLVGFAAGGLIYGPFSAICTALFQRSTPPQALSRVLAARSALTIPSAALGTLLGGLVVSAVGGRPTLLLSALLTIVLGASVAGVLWRRHRTADAHRRLARPVRGPGSRPSSASAAVPAAACSPPASTSVRAR